MRVFFETSPKLSIHISELNQTLVEFISHKFSIKSFRRYAQNNDITKIDNPYYFTISREPEEYISDSYTRWCIKYMSWLFDEMCFPLDMPVIQLEIATGGIFVFLGPPKLSFLYNLYPLDYICIKRKHFPVVPLLDFFLEKKAPSHQNYGWLMNWFKSLYGGEDVWCIKRLLDAGADLEHTTDGNTIAWYRSRQNCRKKCILFMGCAFRRKGMIFPRDVAKIVGKCMWDKRFELKKR